MSESVDVVAVRRLDRAPSGDDRSDDRVYWAADLSSGDDFMTITVCMSATDAASDLVNGQDHEHWIEHELQQLVRAYRYELITLYALSPIELYPPTVGP